MELPVVVIVFLALALLVAVMVMLGVALPHLRSSGHDGSPSPRERRHSSRTGR